MRANPRLEMCEEIEILEAKLSWAKNQIKALLEDNEKLEKLISKSGNCSKCGEELVGWEAQSNLCDECKYGDSHMNEMEDILYRIYMFYHVSQRKYLSNEVREAWDKGKEIREHKVRL
jgi:hypothetical protein